MGRYASLIRDAIVVFAGDHLKHDAVSTTELIQNYNPAMLPQAIGLVLKYQSSEVNALLTTHGIKITSYGWDPRRKCNMIEFTRSGRTDKPRLPGSRISMV